MIERNEDGLMDGSFEVTFRVRYEVANFNDSFLNEQKVRDVATAAGKAAALEEMKRQLVESINDGTMDHIARIETD